jgi:hypothetical protein
MGLCVERTRRLRTVATLSAAVAAVSTFASPVAHADGASFLAALRAQGLSNPPLIGDSGLVMYGHRACEALEAGQPAQDVANLFTLNWVISPHKYEFVDAAQHELCPETLH